jgi:hypothetical protein
MHELHHGRFSLSLSAWRLASTGHTSRAGAGNVRHPGAGNMRRSGTLNWHAWPTDEVVQCCLSQMGQDRLDSPVPTGALS